MYLSLSLSLSLSLYIYIYILSGALADEKKYLPNRACADTSLLNPPPIISRLPGPLWASIPGKAACIYVYS